MATKKKATKKATSGSALAKGLAAVRSSLPKGTDDGVAQLDTRKMRESAPHIPSGSLVIDYLIGGRPNIHGIRPCPGIPRGRIMNLYGQAGAGKTTLALTVAASTCAAGGTVCYIDFENEVEPRYAEILGVPVTDQDRFLLIQPTTLEDGFRYMWTMCAAGVDLVVVDSVGAGVPEDWFKSQEKGEQGRVGLLAAKWSKFLPQLKAVAAKSGTAIVGISQIRSKINTGGYGGPTTDAQGGHAWKFYSAVRMMLRVVKKEKEKTFNHISGKPDEQVTGCIVKAKLEKCKVSDSAHHEQEFYLKSGFGIDDERTILEIAQAYNVVRKSGSFYSWTAPDGSEIKAQGLTKFREALKVVPDVAAVMFAMVEPHMGKVVVEEEEDPTAMDALLEEFESGSPQG
jgi:recombination protein RecA